MVANGPDTTPVRSRTRTPVSGPNMTLSLEVLFLCWTGLGSSLRGANRRSSPEVLLGYNLGRPGGKMTGLFDNRFLDVAKLVLAEDHLLTDTKLRGPEYT